MGELSYKSILVASVLAAAVALPVAVASRNGAIPGHTGGATSFGSGCNACHPYNTGPGGVTIETLPSRYRAGATYSFGVKVIDAVNEQNDEAGFQISVEGGGLHRGLLSLADALRTEFADGDPAFITHTSEGVDDSGDNWVTNGGSYTYPVQWQAPSVDEGPITVFAAGNAVDGNSIINDHYYAANQTLHFAVPGDADGDTDLDLADFAAIQNCIELTLPIGDDSCQYVDFDGDGTITLDDVSDWTVEVMGPVAEFPAGYVLADVVRGGKLYDRWWRVTGAPTPTGDHPLYPEIGQKTGSTTFRCNECHGWDYKGADGQYGSGEHLTYIGGVLDTSLSPKQLFDLLVADPVEVLNGHDMDAYGMSDTDVWDVVRFVYDGVVDTDMLITSGAFVGDSFFGSLSFGISCAECHGSDGTDINFGTFPEPAYVGTIADENPWEFLHKMRFGQPGRPMPAAEHLLWLDVTLIDVGAYAQTLPVD